MARKKDYEIGKGKPPLHTRFKPGQSGNKKGRPKDSRNLATDLAEELNEKVAIQEGGKSKKLSKQRVMLKATLAKGMKGDVRAVNTVTTLIDRLLVSPVAGDASERLTADDAVVLEAFKNQILVDSDGAGTKADAQHPSDPKKPSPNQRENGPNTPKKGKGT